MRVCNSFLSLTLVLFAVRALSAPIFNDEFAAALQSIGISLLNPILSAVKAVLSGQGLVQGVLGVVEGALGTEATYDYVVVGGGTAGNAIGYRLAEAGHSVAIIEAGIYYEIAKPVLGTIPAGDIIGIGSSIYDTVPTVDWAFQTEPQIGANNRKIHYARGNSPGGPVQVGYTNWVSAWATWLEKGMEAIGMERTTGFSSGNLLGYHYSQSTVRSSDQTRSSSAEYIYKAVNENLDKLKVYTQTMAKRIVINQNNTATGVEVKSLGVGYTIHASKEVIISAGAFQSPQLLMVSGIGPAVTLAENNIPLRVNLPGVGQNMWDHIMFGPAYEVNFDTLNRVLHNPVVLARSLIDYINDGTGPLSSNVVEFIGWEKLPQKYRDTWSADTQEALSQFPDDWPEVEHISGNGYIGNFRFPALQQPLNGKQYATILGAMVAPVSRGNVTIKSSDTAVLPLVNPNWLSAKADQEVAISWWRRMREVWNTDVVQEIVIGEEYWPGKDKDTDEEILALIQDSLMTVWHAAGTCKMGKRSDDMAVVDNEAKVFGVQGLRVVDASSYPILPPGHPQSTVYALAEKIAAGIIGEGTI
ncbi:hypothetical protein COL922a_009668 [Colletotrichum nupharicola]|nr:hypothetical protein COL922a_009668 [Colletotrichum nupharicola]